jgi:hypothetical protein
MAVELGATKQSSRSEGLPMRGGETSQAWPGSRPEKSATEDDSELPPPRPTAEFDALEDVLGFVAAFPSVTFAFGGLLLLALTAVFSLAGGAGAGVDFCARKSGHC